MLSLLELSDVVGKPQVKTDLPELLVGSKIRLHFCVRRKNGGRHEMLLVEGQFRVLAAGIDAGCSPQRQVLSCEATGISPVWKSVKKTPEWRRALPPAVAPRTIIE